MKIIEKYNAKTSKRSFLLKLVILMRFVKLEIKQLLERHYFRSEIGNITYRNINDNPLP
ncbi:hypothetical protein [Gillisia sp. Hel_I_29]|uniref:hypothetical protein n=1 Tax=Gillisia sp. Hel_I_29 TaxID=1249975 RepID=UPI000A78BCD7|nr:hypothetical protein [Gillisia sp. Hel_I_29]